MQQIQGGWMGRLLRVDLTEGKTTIEELNPEVLRRYLGGRGLGVRLFFDEVDRAVDPLSAENKLIFTTGPLTGTKAPTSGRYNLSAKSPLTGTIFESNAGGYWGVGLKQCGFDALIVEGQGDKPVYLAIQEGQAELKDAGELWGKTVGETVKSIQEQEGPEALINCIGPAGENQVKLAAIIGDNGRALGRGGIGAVMGAKQLKAIVVKGSHQIPVAKPEQLDFVVYETNKWLKANPITSQGLPEFGSAVLVNLFNELGILPTKNFQESQFPEADKISGETIAETISLRGAGCFNCPIQCGRIIQVPAGEGVGPDYETLGAFGAGCGIADLETICEANFLCMDYGLEPISTGATVACAMELVQRGLLEAPLQFGQAKGLKELLGLIARREGVGARLAEGSRRLAVSCGGEEYAMEVKGLELPAYDPRGMQGMGLAFATSNQGASHLQAFMAGPEVLGSPKMIDRLETGGKAGLTINFQNAGAALDSLGFCRFAALAVGEEYFARLLTAVTGIEYQPQDLSVLGERIWNLERLFNSGAGFTGQDDKLPARLLREPISAGPSQGMTVDLEPMVEAYYRYRGWDGAGQPTPKKLGDLGLEKEGGLLDA